MILFLITVGVSVSLAAFVLLVVAVSSGKARPTGRARWDGLVDNTARHLNGEGEVPRVLQRLERDRPGHAD